jgi:alkanesulfonate monooxygenase SsuD/methylene tetrahydromethanopterin reductase-like flavin-dependent oxidoreductase (luciferase family)
MAGYSIDFGLLLHTRHLIREDHGSDAVAELWETAQDAEAAGFDHLWLGDCP